MKWLRIAVLICVVACATLPEIAFANTSDTVTIHVTPTYSAFTPSGLLITYVSDFQLDVSWTPGTNSTATMVRAKYGSLPVDRNDGYLAYYGGGSSFSDTSVDLEDNGATIFYRAWGQRGGTWEDVGTSNFMENPGMVLVALIILALGLTLSGFLKQNKVLAFGGSGAWMVLGAYAYTKFTTVWDVYYGLFFLCMALVIVCSLEPVLMREKPIEPEPEDRYDRLAKKWGKANMKWAKLDSLFGSKEQENRMTQVAQIREERKAKRFNETGEL